MKIIILFYNLQRVKCVKVRERRATRDVISAWYNVYAGMTLRVTLSFYVIFIFVCLTIDEIRACFFYLTV